MWIDPDQAAVTSTQADPFGAFRSDVLTGLAQRQPAIPARWFYDLKGSELFEQITQLPEYALTRIETALLEEYGADIGAAIDKGSVVVEFGSGSSVKTPLVLRHVDPAAYVPIDISGEFLRQSSADLQSLFPDLPIVPVEADFMNPIHLPAGIPAGARTGFFPGSTIGNMVPATGVDLLRSMRATLGDGARLLIGFDQVKAAKAMIAAYDDAAGITAQFNLNLLTRINRELDGSIALDAFRHRARWNADWNRIEMHLEAVRDVEFRVAGSPFSFAKGQTIHTENSHKYTPAAADLLLRAGHWSPRRHWSDADGNFMIILAEASEPRSAP